MPSQVPQIRRRRKRSLPVRAASRGVCACDHLQSVLRTSLSSLPLVGPEADQRHLRRSPSRADGMCVSGPNLSLHRTSGNWRRRPCHTIYVPPSSNSPDFDQPHTQLVPAVSGVTNTASNVSGPLPAKPQPSSRCRLDGGTAAHPLQSTNKEGPVVAGPFSVVVGVGFSFRSLWRRPRWRSRGRRARSGRCRGRRA